MTAHTSPGLHLTHPHPRATDSPKESAEPTCHRPPSAAVGAPPQPATPKPQADSPSLEQLLSLYLDPELTIADVAFTLGLRIMQALELFKRSDFLEALRDYEREHRRRARLLAATNLDNAARTFIRLTQSDKPETARKAAGAIVRLRADTKTPRRAPEAPRKHPRPPLEPIDDYSESEDFPPADPSIDKSFDERLTRAVRLATSRARAHEPPETLAASNAPRTHRRAAPMAEAGGAC